MVRATGATRLAYIFLACAGVIEAQINDESGTGPPEACPGPPASPTPVNRAVGVALQPTLKWVACSGATSYDVYFGSTSPPRLMASTITNTFKPNTLATGAFHYWKVVAKKAGCATSSPIWSFKTTPVPGSPTQVSPANAASGIARTVTLQWQPGAGATSYDVYFGAGLTPPRAGTVIGTSYAPSALLPQKTYYWRVVSKSATGSKSSARWMFTTQAATANGTWFVNQATGSDTNTGESEDQAFQTIQRAADLALSGDLILVHTGTYREWVHPKASGVTYRCVPGENCVIKGSDVFENWTPATDTNVYKKTIRHSYFQVPGGIGGTPSGNYNPYASNMRMNIQWNWIGRWVSRGQVYWDDDALRESQTKEEMIATPRTWWIERGSTETSNVTIWAHFPADPAEHTVELNVRLACFDPSYWVGSGTRDTAGIVSGPRINALTVEGFHMRHAAPDWAEIAAYQRGLISTNWGHSWKIRYNRFSDSKAVCVASGSIGKDFPGSWDNGAGMDGPPYNRFGVGNHEISHNIIERCGAGGIHGNRGLAASLIEYNLVQDINYQRLMGGLGFAGIHPMTAIDTVIKNNIVRRVYRTPTPEPNPPMQWEAGIWVEFAGQGVRSTGNVIYDIEGILHHFEASHGPMLADNNILWNSLDVDQTQPHFTGVQTSSYQSVFTNNLIVNSWWLPYKTIPLNGGLGPFMWMPHTSRCVGRGIPEPNDGWYVNNIMIEDGSATIVNYPGTTLDWNVFWKGAAKADWEGPNSIVESSFDPQFRIDEVFEDGVRVSFCADSSAANMAGPRISGSPAQAGIGALIPIHPYLPSPSQTIETHSAQAITVDTDILGNRRNSTTVVAGPLATLSTEGEPCSSRNVIVLRAQH